MKRINRIIRVTTSWRLISFAVSSWLSTVSLQHWLLRRRGNEEAFRWLRSRGWGNACASVRKLIDRCDKKKKVTTHKNLGVQLTLLLIVLLKHLCIVTDIDCPMRFRAGVLLGVITPVWLLDLATGLTFLLLGSWNQPAVKLDFILMISQISGNYRRSSNSLTSGSGMCLQFDFSLSFSTLSCKTEQVNELGRYEKTEALNCKLQKSVFCLVTNLKPRPRFVQWQLQPKISVFL